VNEFHDLIEEYLGDDDALTDIRISARRCWFYDFLGYPVRMWQGQGKLFTADGNEWLGTIDANGTDYHKTPALQDGRDGSSASYSLSMTLIDIPGQSKRELYEEMKANQAIVFNRSVFCYLVIFNEGEGLRPATPIVFHKELIMRSPRFAEGVQMNGNGSIVKNYTVTVAAKDANFGRADVPNGTYADTIQKQRARDQGVELDRGSEFLAGLANRTYQVP